MIHTLVGEKRFKDAMDLYFKSFDGQAVRTEDFLWAMSKGAKIDLSQFERWYIQERTPLLHVKESYDKDRAIYTLELTQEIPDSVSGKKQLPYHYPLLVALFDSKAKEIQNRLLHVSADKESFVFENIDEKPVLSINRNFSAPVKVIYKESDNAFLMKYDSDGFNRYEASETFALDVIFKLMEGESKIDEEYLRAFEIVLEDKSIDLMLKSQILELPSVNVIMQAQKVIDVDGAYRAKKILKEAILSSFEDKMYSMYLSLHDPKNRDIDATNIAKRSMKNLLLGYLITSKKSKMTDLALSQYRESVTMTDRVVALDLLENYAPLKAAQPLNDFYEKYSSDTLVMNKYFSILAAADRDDVLDRVRSLQNDRVYDVKVPNLVRSLIGVFARNAKYFHAPTGDGYSFIADKIIELDKINPMIAAGLSGAFKSYGRLDALHKELMHDELKRILSVDDISKNVFEIIQKIVKE
jgi:aminopeptidase N